MKHKIKEENNKIRKTPKKDTKNKKIFLKFHRLDNNLCYGNYFIINLFIILTLGLFISMGTTLIFMYLKIYYIAILSFILSIIFAYFVYKEINED